MLLATLQRKGYKPPMRGRPTTVHNKHHVTHPPKNTATSGKGSSGAGAMGKGIMGNAAHGGGFVDNAQSRSVGVVPPPLSYYHRKPSAPLYSNTAQMKKPAGPVHPPHKPSAGGDTHPWRKPAVHAGIPHANVHAGVPHTRKLPAPVADKNITVRCTWSNNHTAPVHRTVTSTAPSQPNKQVYRVPTPPPDNELPGCQEDLRRKLERLRMHAPQEESVFHFTVI